MTAACAMKPQTERSLRPRTHMRPQSAAPRVHFSEQLTRLDDNIREAREARQKLASSRPQSARAASSRLQTPPLGVPWSQPRSKPSGVFSKKEPTKKPRGPKVTLTPTLTLTPNPNPNPNPNQVVLAEGRALKPVLWFPGNGVAALVDSDLEQACDSAAQLHPTCARGSPFTQAAVAFVHPPASPAAPPRPKPARPQPDLRPRQARLLTSRALGMEVDMCIVRCSRFQGAMAPVVRGDRPLSLCAVCTPSRILGCYELTDGLGGIMFRRMTDTVCRELLSAWAG